MNRLSAASTIARLASALLAAGAALVVVRSLRTGESEAAWLAGLVGLVYVGNLNSTLPPAVRIVSLAGQSALGLLALWWAGLMTFQPVEGALRGFHVMSWPSLLLMWALVGLALLAPASTLALLWLRRSLPAPRPGLGL